MAKPIPQPANLEHFKKEAKTLLKSLRRKDSFALQLAKSSLHRCYEQSETVLENEHFKLCDAQLIVARKYGHRSWMSLKQEATMEMVVLYPKETAVRCRLLGSESVITLRCTMPWDLIPGEILTVQPNKQWRFKDHNYVSGTINKRRTDVNALALTPLELRDEDLWDPADHYWGEGGLAHEDWQKPIVIWGPRESYEMEQVIPGDDPESLDFDPISKAAELNRAGEREEARRLFNEMLVQDLRCIDAHNHLGVMAFDNHPGVAIQHFEMGYRIGQLSLGDNFIGLLPWGRFDNRPFLRCMHSYGLCLWRFNRHEEAMAIFEQMLWFNPTDNQGIRSIIPDLRNGDSWESCKDW